MGQDYVICPSCGREWFVHERVDKTEWTIYIPEFCPACGERIEQVDGLEADDEVPVSD